MTRLIQCCAAALAFAAISSPAQARPNGSGSFRVGAVVPVVCGIDAPSLFVTEGSEEAVGSVQEFCNSARGFQIMASYRPLDAGEKVDLYYAGELTSLSSSGLSPVAFRSGPRVRTVPVSVRSTGLKSDLALSLALTAI
jgi:hypothetical protein